MKPTCCTHFFFSNLYASLPKESNFAMRKSKHRLWQRLQIEFEIDSGYQLKELVLLICGCPPAFQHFVKQQLSKGGAEHLDRERLRRPKPVQLTGISWLRHTAWWLAVESSKTGWKEKKRVGWEFAHKSDWKHTDLNKNLNLQKYKTWHESTIQETEFSKTSKPYLVAAISVHVSSLLGS